MAGVIAGRLARFRAHSLRWRLLRLVTMASLLVWVLAAVLSYRQAGHELRELFDAQMDRSARMLLAQAQFNEIHLAGLPANMAALRGARSRRDELPVEFQIGRADGTLLVRSAQAPRMPLDGAPGFADVSVETRPWRSLILTTERGDYRIQVMQSIGQRDRQVLEMAAQAVIPLIVLFPLLLALIYVSVRRGLAPLDNLARDVATRSLDNLEPVTDHAAPLEARPLVSALNDLLHRLSTTLEHERRFTADAAHELRTPLAVVKVQAQVALVSSDARPAPRAEAGAGRRRSRDASGRTIAAHGAAGPAAASARSATGRSRRTGAPRCREMFEASPRWRAASISPSMTRRCRSTRTANCSPPPCAICSTTPCVIRRPAAALVLTQREDGDALLGVVDAGEGVPPEDLPRLVERFYRGRAARAEGSGLGLAIVQRIAELHDARLEIANRAGGGLDVRLRWRRQ